MGRWTALILRCGVLLAALAWLTQGQAVFAHACCAGLEARIAELESSVARGGGQRVSIKLTGQASMAILAWDDGGEHNIYVVDNDHATTRFALKGESRITDVWRAGLVLEAEVEPANSSRVDQFDDNNRGAAEALRLRKSFLFLEHKRFGKISIGHNSSATEGIVYEDVSENWPWRQPDFDWARNFVLRPKGGSGLSPFRLGDLAGCYSFNENAAFDCTGRIEIVRYESPEIAGFSVSASSGEDDFKDLALFYRGETPRWKGRAGVGMARNTDERLDEGGGGGAGFRAERSDLIGSASLLHLPTGLFAFGSVARSSLDDSGQQGVVTGKPYPDGKSLFLEIGIQRNFLKAGQTSFFTHFTHVQDMLGRQRGGLTRDVTQDVRGFLPASAGAAELAGAKVRNWGLGASQTFEAANFDLFAVFDVYRADAELHTETDGFRRVGFSDFRTFAVGGRLRF